MISHKDMMGIIATEAAKACIVAKPLPQPHAIQGSRLHTLICNAHRLLGKKYGKSPLWSIMSDLTGHGSTISAEICKQNGIDPCQPCNVKYLKKIESNPER